MTGLGLGIPRPPVLPEPSPEEEGSLSLEPCGAALEGLVSPVPVSMVVLTGRAELGLVRVRVFVLDGRGRERYWRDVLAVGDRNPLWSLLDTSKLVLRPPAPAHGLTGMPDVLGILPTATVLLCMELTHVLAALSVLEMFVPLLVVVGGFLKPKFPPAEGRTSPDGGLRCSPVPVPFWLSLPASEEERCSPEFFTANLDLSMGFTSDFMEPTRKNNSFELEQHFSSVG